MAYEAYRDDDRDLETARADANNTNTIRNAADVAIATKNPYAVAAGVAVKTADGITDGKAFVIIFLLISLLMEKLVKL